MNNSQKIQHFILTRFNILLWRKAKDGNPVRTRVWLEHRFAIFEKYCLPSVMGQTCKAFQWIVLFDSTTPECFKDIIEAYRTVCPQFIPVYVEPREGCNFAQIFRSEVMKRLDADRVLTTYLDNDDALHLGFVEDIQRRAVGLPDGTFVNYNQGYQLFTDHKYVMQINFPRNHFMSIVESGAPNVLRTIYGYGSHYYINKIPDVKIEHIVELPMWCEVVHEKNMGNDAYFLFTAKMIDDSDLLRRDFGLNESVRYSYVLYLLKFLPRYVKTFIRRVKYFIFGRNW